MPTCQHNKQRLGCAFFEAFWNVPLLQSYLTPKRPVEPGTSRLYRMENGHTMKKTFKDKRAVHKFRNLCPAAFLIVPHNVWNLGHWSSIELCPATLVPYNSKKASRGYLSIGLPCPKLLMVLKLFEPKRPGNLEHRSPIELYPAAFLGMMGLQSCTVGFRGSILKAKEVSIKLDCPTPLQGKTTVDRAVRVCADAVHSVALWTQRLSQVWACVKYVPKQSIP